MKLNDVISGKISRVKKSFVVISFENGWSGLLHISNISDYYIPTLESIFKVDEDYLFKVIDVDKSKKNVKLDWKSLYPRFQKNPFEFQIKETKNGFKNLKKIVEEEVKNA